MSRIKFKRGACISIHALSRLLIVAGIIKLGLIGFFLAGFGFDRAMVVEAATPSANVKTGPQPAGSEAVGAVAGTSSGLAAAGANCRPEVLQMLYARSRDLEAKARANEKESEDLNLVKNEINSRIKDLKDLEAAMKGPLKAINDAKQGGLQHMMDVYNSMDPAKAAALLDKMDEPIVVQILRGMKSRKVAQIMSFMDPDKAAKISTELAKAGFLKAGGKQQP